MICTSTYPSFSSPNFWWHFFSQHVTNQQMNITNLKKESKAKKGTASFLQMFKEQKQLALVTALTENQLNSERTIEYIMDTGKSHTFTISGMLWTLFSEQSIDFIFFTISNHVAGESLDNLHHIMSNHFDSSNFILEMYCYLVRRMTSLMGHCVICDAKIRIEGYEGFFVDEFPILCTKGWKNFIIFFCAFLAVMIVLTFSCLSHRNLPIQCARAGHLRFSEISNLPVFNFGRY